MQSPDASIITAAGLVFGTGVLLDFLLLLYRPALPRDWPARTRRLAERPWSWQEGGALVFVLLGLHLALIALIRGGLDSGMIAGDSATAVLLIAELCAFDGATLLLAAWILRSKGTSWEEALGMSPARLPWAIGRGVVFCMAAVPVVSVATIVYRTLLSAAGFPYVPQDVLLLFSVDSSVGQQLTLGFLALVAAPLAEETLFRGIALPVLARKIGAGGGVIVTSLVFAAMHGNLHSLLPLFLIASAFSLAYIWTESLWVPVVMHSVFNGVNVLLMLLSGGQT